MSMWISLSVFLSLPLYRWITWSPYNHLQADYKKELTSKFAGHNTKCLFYRSQSSMVAFLFFPQNKKVIDLLPNYLVALLSCLLSQAGDAGKFWGFLQTHPRPLGLSPSCCLVFAFLPMDLPSATVTSTSTRCRNTSSSKGGRWGSPTGRGWRHGWEVLALGVLQGKLPWLWSWDPVACIPGRISGRLWCSVFTSGLLLADTQGVPKAALIQIR